MSTNLITLPSFFKISNELWGEIIIILSLFFFGASFSYQKVAMNDGISPLTYNACRYLVSSFFLFLLKHFYGLKVETEESSKYTESEKTLTLWKYGVILGIANFGGSILQQIGLVSVTAGKTGFITGMYVVFVPIVEQFMPFYEGGGLGWQTWLAAIVSLVGLYLLSGCAEEQTCFGGAIKEGEVIIFISMFFWVISIMGSDIGAKRADVVTLTLIDFSVTTTITLTLALIIEPHYWMYPFTDILSNWKTICIVGFTEAVAFLFSTLGQMYTPPSRAALLFSLEAVVCAIFSFFLLGETLSWIEIVGGFFMFSAALISSVSEVEEEPEEDSKPILQQYDNFGSIELAAVQPQISNHQYHIQHIHYT